MCGIVGYVGPGAALPILLRGLGRLEYRGYDSAGVAVWDGNQLVACKKEGRLARLAEELRQHYPANDAGLPDAATEVSVGIGHTRWATHGVPSDRNAHPHSDCQQRFWVVHNGIIENYRELKEEMLRSGHVFRSETDTEVIPHLIESVYRGDLPAAVREAVSRLRGSFALAVMSPLHPDMVVAYRQESPLVVGLGEGQNFLASDIPALLEHTRRTYILEDGEMAVLTPQEVRISTDGGRPVDKAVFTVQWDVGMAEKAGYPHFMLKEIWEQPRALRDTLTPRLTETGAVRLAEEGLDHAWWQRFRKIHLVACGTAYHAGLVGKYLFETLARIPAEAELASEFRYRRPLVDKDTLVVVISQSGETADTRAALREARNRGAEVLAIVNVVGSSIAREADQVLYTWAGPEIAVASTKAYTCQVAVLTLLALHAARARGVLSQEEATALGRELRNLPALVQEALAGEPQIRAVAKEVAGHEHVFFIGRGLDFAVAQEAQLKLKEISYIHAEAYAAGELKHGTLALVVEGTPVVALATQPSLWEKTVSNVEEVRARGGRVILVTAGRPGPHPAGAEHVIGLPPVNPWLAPLVAVVPMQLLAYWAAVARGCDVDKPRNLAKSVTVE
ncbi:MAG TPA: glutamine--fructose-6-phosphate transaminase (isomerizing) [Firmicutes bacterium]|nr:glutamine--fructose-6-phosphate transaminase (isomerizing) [Bacillota bacterium]